MCEGSIFSDTDHARQQCSLIQACTCPFLVWDPCRRRLILRSFVQDTSFLKTRPSERFASCTNLRRISFQRYRSCSTAIFINACWYAGSYRFLACDRWRLSFLNVVMYSSKNHVPYLSLICCSCKTHTAGNLSSPSLVKDAWFSDGYIYIQVTGTKLWGDQLPAVRVKLDGNMNEFMRMLFDGSIYTYKHRIAKSCKQFSFNHILQSGETIRSFPRMIMYYRSMSLRQVPYHNQLLRQSFIARCRVLWWKHFSGTLHPALILWRIDRVRYMSV